VDLGRLADQLRAARRPLIVCGPQPDTALAAPLAALALALGAPVLADPLSQLRWGAHERGALIDRYDAALRHEATAASLAPDLIMRIGSVPTSKALLQYLHRHASAPMVVVDASRWPDPSLRASEMVHAEPRHLCAQLLHALRDRGDVRGARAEWLAEWRHVDDVTGAALERYSCALAEPFEGRALADVVATLPAGATLFVSSSMPVRDLDAFGTGDARPIRVLANRGANGIDGVVSSALGAAAAAREMGTGPLVLVIGDLALYHDMNGLLAARLHALDATVVVLDNDGGGIFSFLPQAAHETHFEQLFGTPTGLDFSSVAALHGAHHHRVHDGATLRRAVSAGVAGGGLHLVELRTDRARNVVLHREAWAAVADALDRR
jgi:2-succinyl-5-enolpyruvyl-6-hydroxy-3-cyclohexene-1-carboxylate synthase